MEGLLVISCIAVLISSLVLCYTISRTHEPKELKKLDKAVDCIAKYCRSQTEGGRCAYNLNKTNEECDCVLLKSAPEDWHGPTNEEKS